MINRNIVDAIERLSKRLARRHWSETAEDLMQDGMVLVIQLYQKNPRADDEWIYKALHNFYATKSKKMRKYERAKVDIDDIPELPSPPAYEEEEVNDLELAAIKHLIETTNMSKKDIEQYIGTSQRMVYTKLRKARKT